MNNYRITPSKLKLARKVIKYVLKRDGIKLSHVHVREIVSWARDIARGNTVKEMRELMKL